MSDKQCSCERPMIAALLAGAILTLTVGFVLGWAWDKRPGVLLEISILDVMTAFGTFGAVVVALVSLLSTSYSARRKRRMDAALLIADELQKLNYYRSQFYFIAENARLGNGTQSLKEEFLKEFKEANSYLGSLVKYEYSGYDPDFIRLILKTKKSLNQLIIFESIDFVPNLAELVSELSSLCSDFQSVQVICGRAKADLIKWWT